MGVGRFPQFLIHSWAHGTEPEETPSGTEWIHVEQSRAQSGAQDCATRKIISRPGTFLSLLYHNLAGPFTNSYSQRHSVPDSLQNLRHYNCYSVLWAPHGDSFIHNINHNSNKHPLLSTLHALSERGRPYPYLNHFRNERAEAHGLEWLAHILTAWRKAAWIKAGLSDSHPHAPVTLDPAKGMDSRRSWGKNTPWAGQGAHAVCVMVESLLGHKNNESKAFSLSSWSS